MTTITTNMKEKRMKNDELLNFTSALNSGSVESVNRLRKKIFTNQEAVLVLNTALGSDSARYRLAELWGATHYIFSHRVSGVGLLTIMDDVGEHEYEFTHPDEHISFLNMILQYRFGDDE